MISVLLKILPLCLYLLAGTLPLLASEQELELQEVLDSLFEHHPLYQVKLTEAKMADAYVLEKEGGFDPELVSKNSTYAEGYYTGSVTDTKIRQPLGPLGAEIYGGYRLGEGTFPVYEDEYVTQDGGELLGGFKISLLRGRSIDARRQELAVAELLQDAAAPEIVKQQQYMMQQAARAYWKWVIAGQKLLVYEDLLDLSEKRQGVMKRQVEAGDLAAVELRDNERALMRRKALLQQQQAEFDVASYELSLFYYDQDGEPKEPQKTHFLKDLPEVKVPRVSRKEYKDRALHGRPELCILNYHKKKLEAEIALAENQILPVLDLNSTLSQDYGRGTASRDETEWKVMMEVKVPLRLREQRGALTQIELKKKRLKDQRRFLKQRIQTDVDKAYARLLRSSHRIEASRQEVQAARDVESAEHVKFDSGDSNLLFLALRESNRGQAQVEVLEGMLENNIAYNDLLVASGSFKHTLDRDVKCNG